MKFKTKITELLGIEHPIFGGAMAGISDSNLVAAVSNAGGLGILSSAFISKEDVLKEVLAVKAKTDKPFGINLMLKSDNIDEIVEMAIAERVAAVTTGAGSPVKYISALKAAGIKIIPVVPSARLALKMQEAGADAVVAEGQEAGGHIGQMCTMALIPGVADAIKIPLIAAGGVGDGRGMAAAFMLGADGVQIGTRFLSATECRLHPNFKKMLINAVDTDTLVIGSGRGNLVRALLSDYGRFYLKSLAEGEEAQSPITADRLKLGIEMGDTENGSIMAGQIAGIIKKEQSASEIIQEIIAEASGLIGQATGLDKITLI